MRAGCVLFGRIFAALLLLWAAALPVGAQPAGLDGPASDAPAMAGDTARLRAAHAVYEAGDFVRARKRYRALAEQHSIAGMTHLARMYANGEGGRRSDEQALYWDTKAARKGDAHAMYRVADAYRTGRGTPTDSSRADRWYRAAAERGNAQAQWMFGRRLYRRGAHLAGLEWIRIAAWNSDDPRARQFLADSGQGPAAEAAVDEARRRAVLATLAAVDRAARAQNAAGITRQIADDAEIHVRLPGDAGWRRLARADYEALWRDTFAQAEAYAYRRDDPELHAGADGVLAFSQIRERFGAEADARTVDLRESATLRVVDDGTAVIQKLRLDMRD